MGRKRKEEVIVEFLGGSTEDVTGSMVQVTYPKKDKTKGKFLIECGMIQGNTTPLQDYQLNQKMLEKVNAEEIEYVFLSHSHIDHIGNLGALIRNGFNGKIICTHETRQIGVKLLVDGAYIHQKNVDYLLKKNKPVKPLFTQQDVHYVMNQMESYDIDTMVQLNEYISFRLQNNSHCLGACQIELFIKKPSSKIVKIVYTGDLGSRINKSFQPFLKEQTLIPKANLLISESTYGSDERTFNKELAIKERKDMIKQIRETVMNGHRVLIPSFSFSRSQYLMSWMYETFKDDKDWVYPIIVDSKLTNDINNVYGLVLEGEEKEYWEEVLNWDKFHFVREYKETETLAQRKNHPMLIISSSGMLSAGHAITYAKSILENKNDKIIFVGYNAEGTLGKRIQNESQKTVTIDGIQYIKRCNVITYKTFSSHAQQIDLINYFKTINCDLILLHHGNKTCKEELKEKATDELHKIGKTTKIITVDNKNNKFIL